LTSISPASTDPTDVDDLAFTFRFPNLLTFCIRSTPIYINRCRSISVDADLHQSTPILHNRRRSSCRQ
ncbi:hypothetical protein KI387_021726, partial [Taxus chinensis]